MSQAIQYMITSDTTVNVVISGIKSTSPTLIFLHFWGGSSRTFKTTISHLSSHHCIAIDFPGWGSSTGPQTPEAYSIAHLASNIELLLPKLHINNYILLGHSMGGKVAQLIAGRDQVPGLKGVVLLAPAPPTPLILPEEMRERQINAYLSPESAESVVRNVLSAQKLSDEEVEGLVKDMLKGNEFARKAWPDYAMAEDILGEMEKTKVPVLVVCGTEDKVEVLERIGSEVVGNIRGAEMVVVDGAGHLLPVEVPDIVAGYIESFVDRLKG